MTMMSAMRSMKTVPTVRDSRGAVVARLQQVGPVQVAQLGRHEAVDEPRQEQDLGRVQEPDLACRPSRGCTASAGRGAGTWRSTRRRREQERRGPRRRMSCRPSLQPKLSPRRPGRARASRTSAKMQRADRPAVEDAPGQADLALGDRLVERRARGTRRPRRPRRPRASACLVGWRHRHGSSSVIRPRLLRRQLRRLGRWIGSRRTCSGDSEPRIGPVAAGLPRQASKHVLPHRPAGREVDEDGRAAGVPLVVRQGTCAARRPSRSAASR